MVALKRKLQIQKTGAETFDWYDILSYDTLLAINSNELKAMGIGPLGRCGYDDDQLGWKFVCSNPGAIKVFHLRNLR